MVFSWQVKSIAQGAPPWEVLDIGQKLPILEQDDDAVSLASTKVDGRGRTPAPEARDRLDVVREEDEEEREEPRAVAGETPKERKSLLSRIKLRQSPADGGLVQGRRIVQKTQPISLKSRGFLGRVRKARARSRNNKRMGIHMYDAVDENTLLGLVEDAESSSRGVTCIIVHASSPSQRGFLLDISPGYMMRAVQVVGRETFDLRVLRVSRSGYFSPGRPITSIAAYVSTESWRAYINSRGDA